MSEQVNPYLMFEGMTWPNPSDPNETGWRLIYGDPSRADLMFAASVMSSYAHLIDMPQRERNRRVEQIKTATRPTPSVDAHKEDQ